MDIVETFFVALHNPIPPLFRSNHCPQAEWIFCIHALIRQFVNIEVICFFRRVDKIHP